MTKDSTISEERFNEIQGLVMSLPRKYQKMIATSIFRAYDGKGRIQKENEECSERMKLYCRVLVSLFGSSFPFNENMIMSRSRIRVLVDCRRVVFSKLREDGFSYSLIGRLSGYDHCTVLLLCGEMRDAIEVPMSNPSLLEIHKKFIEKLESIGENGYSIKPQIP